jgi:hypothetical protein
LLSLAHALQLGRCMRTTIASFAILGTLLVSACDDSVSSTEQLDTSHDTWEQASDGKAYSYSRRGLSWLGYNGVTTITVREDGVVVRRDFTPSGGGAGWTESGDEIGSHDEGSPAKTLEELYADCDDVLAADPATHDINFELDDQGFLKTCYSAQRSCEEDCFSGIQLDALTISEGGGCKRDGDC